MARQAGAKGHCKVGPGMVSRHRRERKSERDTSGHGESDRVRGTYNEQEGTKTGRGYGQRLHCIRPGLERCDSENMRKRCYERQPRFPSWMGKAVT